MGGALCTPVKQGHPGGVVKDIAPLAHTCPGAAIALQHPLHTAPTPPFPAPSPRHRSSVSCSPWHSHLRFPFHPPASPPSLATFPTPAPGRPARLAVPRGSSQAAKGSCETSKTLPRPEETMPRPRQWESWCRITQTTPEDKWNNLMVLQLVCQGQHPERGPSPQGKITAIVHKASLPAASFPHHSYVWWLDLVILQVFSTLGDSLILWCSAHHTTWGSNRSMRRAWRYSWELRSVSELWECVPLKSPEENWSPQGKQQGYYLEFCIHICCG